MKNYLKETRMLDYNNKNIQELIAEREWNKLEESERLKSIYNFVRDEIKFGYNTSDDISASEVLKDGYGQCNTKGTLLMALLRAVNIPNRVHGSTIDKRLQKGAISGIWYYLAPKNIVHCWVEVYIDEKWYGLEGVIIDKEYLIKLQEINKDCTSTFCGYGVYTDKFQNPTIDWNYNDTYIQNKGVNQDFGVFDIPDDFYREHKQELGLFKNYIYKHFIRHIMNKNVDRIRKN